MTDDLRTHTEQAEAQNEAADAGAQEANTASAASETAPDAAAPHEDRALRVLEFTKIRERLAQLALTPMGAERCRELTPHASLAAAQRALNETEEAMVLLSYMGASPLIYFADVRGQVSLAEKGATLSARSLLDVAECLRAGRAAREALVTDRENTPFITALASRLSAFHGVEQEITDAILSEDEICDRASAALADIRRHIRIANDKVREKLNGMIRSASFQKYLQDAIVTMRQGRYVLPVKQECRQFVPGLVHDQSASGATLFVEPMAVVEINNDLKRLKSEEEQEIARILLALSQRVAPCARQIAVNIDILNELDFLFAKGALAREMRACLPKMNDKGRVNIIRGRHPLIDPNVVVPVNLWIGGDFWELVITGPNTGGKTVTLKTVGLLTLMAQAGLHVPAELGTELSLFEKVYADIGDEQSIEQSLSTFSSHMKNIVTIMRDVTPRDLVLFDELGAGTDPTEGAALAQSILTSLLKQRVTALATTHYSELKAFALSTRGVENASVEFDVTTLRPTYRLSIGIPGKSNAFEISRKLGLSDALIGDAKALLSQDDVRFEDVIANAEYHRQVAEKERAMAESVRAETVKLRDEAEKLRREMEEKRQQSVGKARQEARRVLEDAKREAEGILSELRAMKRQAATPEHEIQQLKKRMEDGIDSLSEGLARPSEAVVASPKDVKVGDTVEIVHLRTQATVLSKPDSRGEVQLQAGIMKLKAHLSQLRLVREEKPTITRARATTGAAARTVPMELDVRGMMQDEAILSVDQYLDEAVMASLKEVSIIHGKGTGALRSGIQDHLRRHRHVESFRLGKFGEGESGVTIVTLR